MRITFSGSATPIKLRQSSQPWDPVPVPKLPSTQIAIDLVPLWMLAQTVLLILMSIWQ